MIELIVVIVIITLLAGAVGIGSRSAIENAKRANCSMNLRQLFLANVAYTVENDGFAPASADVYGKNLQRWHGHRTSTSKPFDGSSGPLSPFLEGGSVRRCPSQGHFTTSHSANAFEASCGGYGYNSVGVGSRTYLYGMTPEAMERGMAPDMIETPQSTVMFCDTAFAQPYGGNPKYLIEYSFAEPYHWVFTPGEESSYRADPSIHFRHRGRANVIWCDGHITAERLQTRAEKHFTKFKLGWFGPENNSLFDIY